MVNLDIFSILLGLLIIFFIIFGLIRFINYNRISTTKESTKARTYLLSPIVIILSLVLVLGIKSSIDIQTISDNTNENIEKIRQEKWELVENT